MYTGDMPAADNPATCTIGIATTVHLMATDRPGRALCQPWRTGYPAHVIARVDGKLQHTADYLPATCAKCAAKAAR